MESGTELEILGDGSVETTGGYLGAGIGGGSSSDGGTITISGGTVTATGGSGGGAGIGGGESGSAGTIIITGGTVTASNCDTSLSMSPAIGGKSGTITISGGTVNATNRAYGAAIGSAGSESSKSSYSIDSITISGGIVNAINTYGGPAIGAGQLSKIGTITISGGTIYAEAQGLGAGIGAGAYGDVDTINITGGTITAIGSNYAAGIGSCTHSSSFNDYYSEIGAINISGGNINATGGSYGAGIGGSYSSWSKIETINITDGTVTATGGKGAAGIGCGYNQSSINSIDITGGIVFAARGASEANDIGGSKSGLCSSLSIGIDAKIFTANNSYSSFSTISHVLFSYVEAVDGKVYGETIPSGWSGAYACLLPSNIFYNDNGGSGAKTVTVPRDCPTEISDSSGLSMSGYTFSEWNTSADGTGTTYNPGDEITVSSNLITLYAIWEAIEVTSVTLSSSAETLSAGETASLSATVTPSDAADTSVTWTSSDTSVATISSSGVVTAVSAGTATITAANGSLSDTCAVTVTQPITSVNITASTLDLTEGGTAALTCELLPSNAETETIYWSSSDSSVASVDSNGKVLATGIGTATITATASGFSDTCSVTVSKRAVTSVTLNYSSKSLYLGDVTTLTATVSPSDATYPTVTWTSSDTSVATVVSGVVQAVGEGACTISAEADGVSDTCSVYVGRVAVTSVDLSYTTLSMYVDDQRVLTADVSPSDATNSDVTWESSDESVATVNSNGVVTAVSVGTATITATADGISDSCAVTVNYDPEVEVSDVDFIVENSSVTVMYVGDTLQLTVAVTPSDATDTSVTWSSSDTEILTVTEYGLVTAKSAGDATITVTAQGNTSATYKITVKTLDGDAEDYDSDGSAASATATPEVVIQTEDTDVYLTFDLDVSNLGEDAKYIQLPNDEIIDIEGKEVVSISILTSDLDNGSLEIVTLDEDMVALGSVTLSAGVVTDDSDEDSGLPWFTVLIWTIGAVGLGVGATLMIIRLIYKK